MYIHTLSLVPRPCFIKVTGGKTGPGRHCQGRSAHALVTWGNRNFLLETIPYTRLISRRRILLSSEKRWLILYRVLTNEIRRAAYAIAKSDEYTEWFPKGNYGYPRYSGTN